MGLVMVYVIGFAISYEPTENYLVSSALHGVLVSFSSLLWFFRLTVNVLVHSPALVSITSRCGKAFQTNVGLPGVLTRNASGHHRLETPVKQVTRNHLFLKVQLVSAAPKWAKDRLMDHNTLQFFNWTTWTRTKNMGKLLYPLQVYKKTNSNLTQFGNLP